MSILFSLLLDNLVWIVGAIVGLLGLFFARKSGSDAEKVKRAKAEQRAREAANEQDSMIDALPSDEAREELRKHWSRK